MQSQKVRDEYSIEPWPNAFCCYALTAADAPLQIRYIGMTGQHPALRLADHVSEKGNSAKQVWLRDCRVRGVAISLRVLSVHQDAEECLEAETDWQLFWSQYCDLLGKTPSRNAVEFRRQLASTDPPWPPKTLLRKILPYSAPPEPNRETRQVGTVCHNGTDKVFRSEAGQDLRISCVAEHINPSAPTRSI